MGHIWPYTVLHTKYVSTAVILSVSDNDNDIGSSSYDVVGSFGVERESMSMTPVGGY